MASRDDIVLIAHDLVARANSTSTSTSTSDSRPPIFKIVGLILAISSGLFIGVSFVLKKLGLLKANVQYNEEAGEGYGYLKNVWWWSGMTLMIIGEICNFVAYAFVDAILVTPLGALAVVVTTILSAIFLKERLSFVGKIGCFNCIIGSVVIVLNAPDQSAVSKIQDMQKLVISPGFLSYAGVVIVGCIFTALWAGPRYGKKSMMVYLTICSFIGGLSVVATQGLGAAIVTQIGGTPQFNQWFLYVLLVFVITTLVTEIIYLNKALNLFNAALVTPTYYVYFTSTTIVTSAILFRGFKGTAISITTVIMGFLQICSGVVLLQLSKSAKDVPDAAVFTGDLDQVRTVAEQKEPEYEPKADAIRGGAAIIRTLSTYRQKEEMKEAEQIRQSRLEPLRENEVAEWDGLRRRRTIIEPGTPTSIQRRKTLHPPLGRSSFPAEDEENSDDEMHPGFFSRRKKHATQPPPLEHVALSGLSKVEPAPNSAPPRSDGQEDQPHTYGLPDNLRHSMQEDTSYKGPGAPGSPGIHWAPSVDERPSSRNLGPPRPPPHTAKRQFSFQNPFSRHRHSEASDGAASPRPSTARSGLSFTGKSRNQHDTEEERLGLVKGDSSNIFGIHNSSPPEYSDPEEDWQMAGATESSTSGPLSPEMSPPVHVGVGDAGASVRDFAPRRQRGREDDDSS